MGQSSHSRTIHRGYALPTISGDADARIEDWDSRGGSKNLVSQKLSLDEQHIFIEVAHKLKM